MGIPAACQPFQKKSDDLKKQIMDIQNSPCYIQTAKGPCAGPNPGKPDPGDLLEVKKLWKEVGQVDAQFDQCMIQHGGLPDLLSAFTGTATLTTSDPDHPGPYPAPAPFTLRFHEWDHKTVTIESIPEIVVQTNSGTIKVSMTGGGGGSFDPGTGLLAIAVTMHFNLPFGAFDSDISWNLSTENPGGTRVTGALLPFASAVILTASAIFQGGTLGGEVGTIALAGSLFPSPRPITIEPA